MIKIAMTGVFVDDQATALAFYTDVLGMEKKNDLPLGKDRWLTVAAPAGPEGVELVLEPNGNPIAGTFQRQSFEAGIPATTFAVDDLRAEHARMTNLGVLFTQEPIEMGPVITAVFDDTCGNLVMLIQTA